MEIHASSLSALAGRHRFKSSTEAIRERLERCFPTVFNYKPAEYGPDHPITLGIQNEAPILEAFQRSYPRVGVLNTTQERFSRDLGNGLILVGRVDGINAKYVVEAKYRTRDTFDDYPQNSYDLDQLAAYAFLTQRRYGVLLESNGTKTRHLRYGHAELLDRFSEIVGSEEFLRSAALLTSLYAPLQALEDRLKNN